MLKCEICGRVFNSSMGLSSHISRGHKITLEDYYLKYINPEKVKCPECGKDVKFGNLKHGYINKYCSVKCSVNSEIFKNKSKETCLKRYGCKSSNQSEEMKNKSKETCLKRYGCEYPSQSEEIRNKKKETCKKNFGVEHPFQSEEVKNKSKETCKKNYGCEHSSQSEKVKNKRKATCKKNYGFEHALQNEIFKNKSKETCKKNYGVEYPFQSDEVKNKSKETCKKNYGVEHPSQTESFKNKKKETCKEKYGCEYASQNKEVRNKRKETCKINLGCEYPMQNKEVRNKSKLTCNKNFGCDHVSQNKEICNKMSEKRKLTFEKVQKKYPDLVICEELISGPNGEILGHCKNSNCKNSKENGGYFELNVGHIGPRNIGINSISDGNYIYCCEECKHSCPLYRKSAIQLHSLISSDSELSYTQQEYLTFRNEVLSRQLQENSKSENFCEICHSTENLQVHHIQPQKLEPGYSLDPPNGLILCQKCHSKHGHEKETECSTGNLANKICK